jgi:hypothetical protein
MALGRVFERDEAGMRARLHDLGLAEWPATSGMS